MRAVAVLVLTFSPWCAAVTTCGDIKNLYRAFGSTEEGCCGKSKDFVRPDLQCDSAQVESELHVGVARVASSLAGKDVPNHKKTRAMFDFGNGMVLKGHGCSGVSVVDASTHEPLHTFKPEPAPEPADLHFGDDGVEDVIVNNSWTMIGAAYTWSVDDVETPSEQCKGLTISGDRTKTWEAYDDPNTFDGSGINGWLSTDKQYGDYMVDMMVRVKLPEGTTSAQIDCDTGGAGSNGGVMLRAIPKTVLREGWPQAFKHMRGVQFEVDGGYWRGCADSEVMTGLMYGEGWAGADDATYTQNERGELCWEHLYLSKAERKTYAPVTEWNRMKLKFVGNTMESWVNGKYIGKFVDNGGHGLALTKGHFSVQQHVTSSKGPAQGAMQYACIKAKQL